MYKATRNNQAYTPALKLDCNLSTLSLSNSSFLSIKYIPTKEIPIQNIHQNNIVNGDIVNVNIRMYNFDDVQCTVIPSVAYGFVTGMNLQLC